MQDPCRPIPPEERMVTRAARAPSLTRLHEKVTQFSAQHLPECVARQRFDEDDGRWSLVVNQALRAVGPKATLIKRSIVADDDCGDPLAAAIVGQPDHG